MDWANAPVNCSAPSSDREETKILDQYLNPTLKQQTIKQMSQLKQQIKGQFRTANLTASFKKVFEVQ